MHKAEQNILLTARETARSECPRVSGMSLAGRHFAMLRGSRPCRSLLKELRPKYSYTFPMSVPASK